LGAVGVLARERAALARLFRGVKDSKRTSPSKRLDWVLKIKNINSAFVSNCRGRGDRVLARTTLINARFIDRHGLGKALMVGVARLIKRLGLPPAAAIILLDGGLKAPPEFKDQRTIVKGDEKEWLIALASIIAKVRRDQIMIRLAKKFPAYGFERHKGYGTAAHYEAIRRRGWCEIHRRSFGRARLFTKSPARRV
jgi:ribonuclease HII